MAGKKTKVFLAILIVLTLTMIAITFSLDLNTLQQIQLSPAKGLSAWEATSETSQIAYLSAIGSCLVIILMIELILLRRIKHKHSLEQDLNPTHLATSS